MAATSRGARPLTRPQFPSELPQHLHSDHRTTGARTQPARCPSALARHGGLTWPELLHQHQAPPRRVEEEDGHTGQGGRGSAQEPHPPPLPVPGPGSGWPGPPPPPKQPGKAGWAPSSDGESEAQAGRALARVTVRLGSRWQDGAAGWGSRMGKTYWEVGGQVTDVTCDPCWPAAHRPHPWSRVTK